MCAFIFSTEIGLSTHNFIATKLFSVACSESSSEDCVGGHRLRKLVLFFRLCFCVDCA